MRVGAVLLAQASVVAFSLKVTNEGSRFLRVEPGSSTISCPVDLIPEGIPNTIVLNKPGVDGRNTLVYKCNRGSVASNASPSSDNPREFSVACKSGKDGSIVVAKTDVSCVPARCALDSLLGLRHATIDLPDTVKGSSVAIDSVVTIECKEGFSIDGVASGPRSRQLKCDQDQQLVTLYSPLEENDCKAVSCGQLTVPDNSFIASGEKPMQKLSYGDQVKFSCRDAYFFKPSLPSPGAVTGTSFSMFCDANGDFVTVGDAGACVPISCPIPPVFDGADLVAIHTDAVHVADQIAFVCHRGAHFINSTAEIVTPVSSKHWTASAQSLVPQRTRFEVNCLYDAEEKVGYYDTDPTIARCEPERCPPPLTDLPSNIVMKSELKPTYFVGDSVEYDCANGFLFKGLSVSASSSISATCGEDKKWIADDSFDQCKIGYCGITASIPKEFLKHTLPLTDLTTQIQINQAVQVECESGFATTTSEVLYDIRCTSQGKFEAASECKRRCGPLPPLPSHSKVTSGGKYSEGERMAGEVTFTCIDGYSLDGKPLTATGENAGQTLACSVDLSREDFDPPVSELKPCVKISCGLPIAIDRASWTATEGKLKQYSAGESLVYKCEDGFGAFAGEKMVSHSISVQCTASGWNKSADKCAPITCPDNPRIDHGTMLSVGSSIKPGGRIEVQCQEGYIGASAELECGEFGDYLPQNYQATFCAPVECPDLPAVIMGASKSSAAPALKFGETPGEYRCDPKWNLPPITVKCQADKTYEVIGQECIEPKCQSAPETLQHATISGSLSAKLGTTAPGVCEPGYSTVDASLEFAVECKGPGVWVTRDPALKDGCTRRVAESEGILVR